jgi:hypothetical protein
VSEYRSPAIVASYAVAALIADAAACAAYPPSDKDLKERVQPIEGSVSRLRGLAEE